MDKIVEGLEVKDVECLKQPYAKDVVSFDVEPPLQHVGLEAKLKNWEQCSEPVDRLGGVPSRVIDSKVTE
ncbi:hypothetical protein [Microbispora bryophytorum]|uniref:hypothetical protein n=1 Tax=Microbispora bryophytorum TaxID=1460882 RepID=UPI0033F35F86